MAKAFIRQLPRVPNNSLPEDAYCPICVQPYENLTTDSGSFEKAVSLPCHDSHIFGSDCLSEWLRHRKTCPICRRETTFLDTGNAVVAEINTQRAFLAFTMQRNQEWEEYWYVNTWILHLQGDQAIESKWQQWQQDWFAAAELWDQGCQARARAALSLSPITPSRILQDPLQVKISGTAMQTLRFREYRLFWQFQANAAEHPELKAPPGFQLTPTQENVLFRELEHRGVFPSTHLPDTISRRHFWNKIREVGFVWDPNWEVFWKSGRGRWSRHAY